MCHHPGEPIDLIDLKFLPRWVKEDWSATRHAGFEGEEERAPTGRPKAWSGALVRRVHRA
jgi:hypothetical protein